MKASLVWVAVVWGLSCHPSAGKPSSAKDGSAPSPRAELAPQKKDVTAEDYVGPALPRARVLLKDAYGGVHAVQVEVAATPDARQRGLMWREQLAEGTGMLFIFGEEEEHSFWMRNTLIPLDMLFIGKDLRVVGIVHRAEPKTLVSRTVEKPSLYVLEVPGGWAEKMGVVPGPAVGLEGVSTLEVVP